MKKRLIFALLAMLLLAPWPVAYAYDNTKAGTGAVQIEAAQPSAAPSWKAYGGAIGGVSTPGDLFYIDTTGSTADISTTLYLTNSDELIHQYRYLILRVGVYSQTGVNQWSKAARVSGEALPDTYITMQTGKVDFTLPGDARYKVTIDGGSFYASRNTKDGSSPQFYLTVE